MTHDDAGFDGDSKQRAVPNHTATLKLKPMMYWRSSPPVIDGRKRPERCLSTRTTTWSAKAACSFSYLPKGAFSGMTHWLPKPGPERLAQSLKNLGTRRHRPHTRAFCDHPRRMPQT